MRRNSSEWALFWIRLGGIMLTAGVDGVTVLQLWKVITVSDILFDPKVYLTITLLMVFLMLWWLLESEIKLRQVWDDEPNILPINDDRVEILTSTQDSILRYGPVSSLGYYLTELRGQMYLLYIDFINNPKVSKNNAATGVSGFVEYYDMEGKKIKEIYGRWIGMPEADEEKNS